MNVAPSGPFGWHIASPIRRQLPICHTGARSFIGRGLNSVVRTFMYNQQRKSSSLLADNCLPVLDYELPSLALVSFSEWLLGQDVFLKVVGSIMKISAVSQWDWKVSYSANPRLQHWRLELFVLFWENCARYLTGLDFTQSVTKPRVVRTSISDI